MNRQQTISTHYTVYSDIDFINLGQNIVLGMTDSKFYPAPPSALKELPGLLESLTGAVQRMKTGLKAATQERDYLRAQAEAALRELTTYALGATPGRPDVWATANFPLTRGESTPRPASLPTAGLALADGPSAHTLLATVEAQSGMYAYAWRIFPKATPAQELAAGYCYRLCLTREPKALLDGLESGTAYGVECAAWNNTGPLQWSAPVFRIVQ